MMWSAMIFALSLTTLLMFFVSYCRSLMASSSRHALSREVRDVLGIKALPSGSDFLKVMQLLQLCPERSEDRTGLQAVGVYYQILDVAHRSFTRFMPSLDNWTEHELAGCTNFAAVVLDRRIAFSRELLAQQGEI